MSISIATYDLRTIVFDSLLSESTSNTSSLTTSPVEKGFNISDGITPSTTSLRIEAVVTDTPKGATVGFEGKSDGIKEELKEFARDGTLLIVTTDSQRYENMVLISIGEAREGKPNTKTFSLQFAEVVLAETKTTLTQGTRPKQAKNKTSVNSDKKDLGKTEVRTKSFAASAADTGEDLIKSAQEKLLNSGIF